MYIAYPPALLELQGQLREYFRSLLTPGERDGAEIGPERYAEVRRQLVDWAAATPAPPAAGSSGSPGGSGRLIDEPAVRLALARVDARLEAMKLLNWRMVATLAAGHTLAPADAAAAKIYGTEVLIEACRALLEVVGQAGYLTRTSPPWSGPSAAATTTCCARSSRARAWEWHG